MKRFLTTLVTVLVLTAALAVTASASTYDAAAEDLSKIGMFRGTEQGLNWIALPPVPRPPSCWYGSMEQKRKRQRTMLPEPSLIPLLMSATP